MKNRLRYTMWLILLTALSTIGNVVIGQNRQLLSYSLNSSIGSTQYSQLPTDISNSASTLGALEANIRFKLNDRFNFRTGLGFAGKRWTVDGRFESNNTDQDFVPVTNAVNSSIYLFSISAPLALGIKIFEKNNKGIELSFGPELEYYTRSYRNYKTADGVKHKENFELFQQLQVPLNVEVITRNYMANKIGLQLGMGANYQLTKFAPQINFRPWSTYFSIGIEF